MNSKNEYSSFEEAFKQKLSDHSVKPSNEIWSNVNSQLSRLNFFKFSLSHLNIWYASVIIVISAVGIISYSDFSSEQNQIEQNSNKKITPILNNESKSTNNNTEENTKNINNSVNTETISTNSTIINNSKKNNDNTVETKKTIETVNKLNSTTKKETRKNHKSNIIKKDNPEKGYKIVYSKRTVGKGKVQRDTVLVKPKK